MSKKIGSDELQIALFSALSGSISCSVRDFVSDNSVFPVVVIGEDFGIDRDTKTENLQLIRANINVWSRAKSWKESKELAQEIITLLESPGLSLSSFNVITQKYELRSLRDPDGKTRRVLIELEVLIEQTS